MSRARALYRLVRRYLPFWCTSNTSASSWLDECSADGRGLQIEWLGLIVSLDVGRRCDRAIAHNDAVFAEVIPARFNTDTSLWECKL